MLLVLVYRQTKNEKFLQKNKHFLQKLFQLTTQVTAFTYQFRPFLLLE